MEMHEVQYKARSSNENVWEVAMQRICKSGSGATGRILENAGGLGCRAREPRSKPDVEGMHSEERRFKDGDVFAGVSTQKGGV